MAPRTKRKPRWSSLSAGTPNKTQKIAVRTGGKEEKGRNSPYVLGDDLFGRLGEVKVDEIGERSHG